LRAFFILGIVLLASGAVVLGYDHYSYTTTESILRIGPLTANAERTHTVWIPPFVGWLLLAGGVIALLYAVFTRR